MSRRDSLGRLYHQPPYPFMRPALDDVRASGQPTAVKAFRKAIEAA